MSGEPLALTVRATSGVEQPRTAVRSGAELASDLRLALQRDDDGSREKAPAVACSTYVAQKLDAQEWRDAEMGLTQILHVYAAPLRDETRQVLSGVLADVRRQLAPPARPEPARPEVAAPLAPVRVRKKIRRVAEPPVSGEVAGQRAARTSRSPIPLPAAPPTFLASPPALWIPPAPAPVRREEAATGAWALVGLLGLGLGASWWYERGGRHGR